MTAADDRIVPVLITWDVDPTPEVTLDHKHQAFETTCELMARLNIQATFFWHARLAQKMPARPAWLVDRGHEVGCHGLTHGDEEEYGRMAPDMQQRYLTEATAILEDAASRPVRAFRGPRVKTSATTQDLLEGLGYAADCSVASQRLDFVSSNLVNVNWLLAPRLPYHPSQASPFRRGQRSLWVIPLSAMGLPFISSSLYVFGVWAMRRLFDALYRESLASGKPIVYLAHPFELAPWTQSRPASRLGVLRRLRTHGLALRGRFYQRDHRRRLEMNEQLLGYIASRRGVQFVGVTRYVDNFLAGPRVVHPRPALAGRGQSCSQ